MRVWRLLAPLLVLLVVVGVVSLIAASDPLQGLAREPAAAPSTSPTLELPLLPEPSAESSAGAGIGEGGSGAEAPVDDEVTPGASTDD